jgi:hypothetical protein
MTDQHPITPPLDLVEKWTEELCWTKDQVVFTRVAQWGADQELEACCEWLSDIAYRQSLHLNGSQLRAARRPQPPTLKEQAIAALHAVATGANDTREQHQDLDTIRQALEALPN